MHIESPNCAGAKATRLALIILDFACQVSLKNTMGKPRISPDIMFSDTI